MTLDERLHEFAERLSKLPYGRIAAARERYKARYGRKAFDQIVAAFDVAIMLKDETE